MPAAEVDVTDELVRALLVEQHPDLADLPLHEFANGWDNVMFRLGEELVVRVPRREMSARLVDNEHDCLPALAPLLPITIPAPIRGGAPSSHLGYPWSWNVLPWIGGAIASTTELDDPDTEARRLGEFLATLHVAAPGPVDVAVPVNPFRGHFIGQNTPVFAERVGTLGEEMLGPLGVTVEQVTSRWVELVDVAEHDEPPVWLHGDLHTLNVLVDGGAISGIIDWGDICAGDPATDLAVGWMLFDTASRDVFRSAAGGGGERVDDATWQRAEAWALHFAITYLAFSADHAELRRVAARLLAELFG